MPGFVGRNKCGEKGMFVKKQFILRPGREAVQGSQKPRLHGVRSARSLAHSPKARG
jgi:hypothetical protein